MGSQEKIQVGIVVSNKMDKTVVVRIDRSKRHRLYGKTLRVTRRYKAHDENNDCRLGDVVRIAETRPMSREKRWRVVDVLVKGDVAELAPRDIGARIIEETRESGVAEAAAAAAVALVMEADAAMRPDASAMPEAPMSADVATEDIEADAEAAGIADAAADVAADDGPTEANDGESAKTDEEAGA